MDDKRDNRTQEEEVVNLYRQLEEQDRKAAERQAAMPGTETTAAETSVVPALEDLLIIPDEEDTDRPETDGEEEELPPAPARRNPIAALWRSFRTNLPAKGDGAGDLVRKCAFLLALIVLISSLGYIVVDVCIIPMHNTQMYGGLEELYDPEDTTPVSPDEGNYPDGMLASFRELYDRNDEVRGWLSYHATGKKDFLKIEYPVMFSGDNDKYLKRDFFEKKNKNGALFYDENNRLDTAMEENKSLIIYGHNMASGQMFAGMNKLIGSVNNARATATMEMSTLFVRSEYRVFAVVLTDEEETARWYFNTRRTQFSGDADFLNFVQQLRDRSMFDYPVDVNAQDELLVLSTCTAKSTSKLNDGRLVIIARKTRLGEGAVHTSEIQRNKDVIMPRAWYLNQDKELHSYYGGDRSDLGTTTTKGSTSTTSGIGTLPTGTLPTGTGPSGSVTGSMTAPVGGTTHGSTAHGSTAHGSMTTTGKGTTGNSTTTGTTAAPTSGTTTGTTASTSGTTSGDATTSTTGSSAASTDTTASTAAPTDPTTESTDSTTGTTQPSGEVTEPSTEGTDPEGGESPSPDEEPQPSDNGGEAA